MNDLLLSICIPTYRHGPYLDKLLESIPDSYADKIELCISNNVFPDNTDEVIEKHRPRFPHFRYVKRDSYVEFDGNLETVLTLPTAKYTWTIGSDDKILPGALDRLFKILNDKKPGVIITSILLHDVNHRWEKMSYYLPPEIKEFGFKFCDTQKLTEYFNLSLTLGALGAFISSNIMKTSLIKNAVIDINFAVGYSHIHRLFHILADEANAGEEFLFLNDNFICATAGNDETSLGGETIKFRMFLDFNTVPALAEKYFKDPELRQSCIHVLRRQHPFWWLYRSMIVPECDEKELALLKKIFPVWWINFMLHFSYKRNGIVHSILKGARTFRGDPRAFFRRTVSFFWRVFFYNPYQAFSAHLPYMLKCRIDVLALLNKPGTALEFCHNGLSFFGPVESLYLIPEMSINAYTKFISGCERVLDLGGYIGESALTLASCNREIWVFEPEEEKFRYIGNNIRRNNMGGRIKAHRFAVVRDDSKSMFMSSRGAFDGSASLNQTEGIPVPCKSIGKIMEEASFDGLKMDIEGGEYEIFSYFLDNPGKFTFQRGVIELHLPETADANTAILDKFLAFLESQSMETVFYKYPSKLRHFHDFAEIRSRGKSPSMMMGFYRKIKG